MIDVGGVMAICLMYLTDSEATIEQTTNASLTKLLRIQTQLATGMFSIEMRHLNQIYCLLIVGKLDYTNGKDKSSDQQTISSAETIQVNILVYFVNLFCFCFVLIQYLNNTEYNEMNGQVPFLSVCFLTYLWVACY